MSVCLRCGAPFSCAMLGEMDGPCWCTELPRFLPVPGVGASCFCPGCLKMEIATQQAASPAGPAETDQ
jgi:hypothetical protein